METTIMDLLRSPSRRKFLGRALSASVLYLAANVLLKAPNVDAVENVGNSKDLQTVDFVHVADLHAAYNGDAAGSSPMARIRGYVEEARRHNPLTLFTNSGDDYEKGSLAEQLSRGGTTRQIVQALGFDLRTLGNHDFAWGMEEMLRFSDDATAAVLCANATIKGKNGASSTDSGGPVEFTVRQVGRLKIGFFGLTTRPYGGDSLQHDGPIYPNHPELITDFDHLAIARRIIARYRHEVDLLVLVSHLGITDDQTIARKTEGIDIILGGHSHSRLTEPLRVKNTSIIHVGSNGESFGHLRLTYDLGEKAIHSTSLQLIDNRPTAENATRFAQADSATEQRIATILAPYQAELSEVVGMVKKHQDRHAISAIAGQAALATMAVDAALVEPLSVWREWQPGQLNRQDIFDAFQVEREPVDTPGTSSLYQLHLTGTQLLQARLALADCVFTGPQSLDPHKTYRLAVQKNRFFGRPDLFPDALTVPTHSGTEVWQVVSRYAAEQWRHNLALDEGRKETLEIVALDVTGNGKHPTL
jgi:5'-nucleotidase / UDP-sugar diphosphatase